MSPPSMRRVPVQRRSAERLTRILDACAHLLDETGYDGLSTRAVAQRAGVPIGSVYRFFPNKRALADALAHRNLDEYAGRIAVRLTPAAGPAGAPDPGAAPGGTPDGSPVGAPGRTQGRGGDWRWAVDVVVDEYLTMKRGAPGFGMVEFSVPSPAAAAPEQPNHLVADRLLGLLADFAGFDASGAARERLRMTFLVAVEAADALLRLAFRVAPEGGDPVVIEETKSLLHAYLAGVLD